MALDRWAVGLPQEKGGKYIMHLDLDNTTGRGLLVLYVCSLIPLLPYLFLVSYAVVVTWLAGKIIKNYRHYHLKEDERAEEHLPPPSQPAV